MNTQGLLCLLLMASAPVGTAVAQSTAPMEGYATHSIVSVPEAAGKFRLVQASLDDTTITADYRYDGMPDGLYVRIQASAVGPFDGSYAEASESLATSFLQALQRSPANKSVTVVSSEEADLPAPPSFLRGNKSRYASPAMIGLLAVKQDSNALTVAVVSTYRNLYGINVIATGNADAKSQDDYGRLAADVAMAVVPQIEIRNFGNCGDGPGVEKGDSLDQAVFNCAPSEADQAVPLPADGKRFDVVYKH